METFLIFLLEYIQILKLGASLHWENQNQIFAVLAFPIFWLEKGEHDSSLTNAHVPCKFKVILNKNKSLPTVVYEHNDTASH